ncbi:hypothetical protein ACJX0J_020416 [Zea mays]
MLQTYFKYSSLDSIFNNNCCICFVSHFNLRSPVVRIQYKLMRMSSHAQKMHWQWDIQLARPKFEALPCNIYYWKCALKRNSCLKIYMIIAIPSEMGLLAVLLIISTMFAYQLFKTLSKSKGGSLTTLTVTILSEHLVTNYFRTN